MQYALIKNEEINPSKTLYPLKAKEIQKIAANPRPLESEGPLKNAKKTKKNEYPNTPHTGTGTPINMAYGLWETVSQLIAREMAQKLR